MTKLFTFLLFPLSLGVLLSSCALSDDEAIVESTTKKVDFDILITRDGQVVQNNTQGIMTRGAAVSGQDSDPATLDENSSFGIVGIDAEEKKLVIDNKQVYSNGAGRWGSYLNTYEMMSHEVLSLSAYYPYVTSLIYEDSYATYTIPYETSEIDAGPLVSKTVETAVSKMSLIPLVFQHVTNDIGFKVCDATPDENIQGLIHLKKLVACNVASAGFYVDSLGNSRGVWKGQGFYRDVTVFEGDAKVGIGSEHELYVGYDELVPQFSRSHRFYAVPDEIKMGKQTVELTFDVESFTLNGHTYPELKNQVFKYMIYGLLPDNVCKYGKMYTFHIGMDLSALYQQITFNASVMDWSTNIYENHDDF